MYTLYYYYVLLGTYYSNNNRGIREEAKIAINSARLMVLTIIETVFLPLFNNTTPTSTKLATYTGTIGTNILTSNTTYDNNNTNITTNTANNKLLASLRYLALRLFNMNTLPEYRRDAMIGSELYGKIYMLRFIQLTIIMLLF